MGDPTSSTSRPMTAEAERFIRLIEEVKAHPGQPGSVGRLMAARAIMLAFSDIAVCEELDEMLAREATTSLESLATPVSTHSRNA